MDLFNLIRASNPTKVKVGTRPRAAHEVSLLTVTASRVIEMEDPAATTDSSGVPSTIERSPMDFANENPSQQSTGGNGTKDQGQEIVATEVPPLENVTTTGVAPKACLVEEISAMGPRMIKERRRRRNDEVDANAPPKETPADVSDPDPLSFTNPQSIHKENVAQSSKGASVVGDLKSENTFFTFIVGSPESIYQPEWCMTNGCSLDAPETCQDLVDHLRLRFKQEANLLKKFVAQVARWDQRIQARENEIKNLEALLEAETDMKKAAEAKNVELAQVTGEEKLKAAFEEFNQYEDVRVEKRCAEMDARLDALGIDFDDELYPHMLTMIASRRWVIGHGFHLAVMKCGESTKLRQVFDAAVSAWIAKDVIMASLHLESYSGEDAPQWIRELRPSSSQLKIPVYPEKNKCRVVCRTHGVSSTHHARSDGVPVSVSTVALQARSHHSSSKSRFSRSSSSLCITSTAAVRYVGIPISVAAATVGIPAGFRSCASRSQTEVSQSRQSTE
nr:hypothetical protein [Tanacetum cinerariifolium]